MEKKKVQYAIFVFSIIAVFLAILGYSVRRKLLEEKEIKADLDVNEIKLKNTINMLLFIIKKALLF